MDAVQAQQVIDLLTQIKPVLEDLRYMALYGFGLMLGGMCGIVFWVTMRGAS